MCRSCRESNARQGEIPIKNHSSVVPRGANNGAIRLASGEYETASDCTEERETRSKPTNGPTLENTKETRRNRTNLPQLASNCTEECERGDSNPHALRHKILSLARLPIPPLSRCVSAGHTVAPTACMR